MDDIFTSTYNGRVIISFKNQGTQDVFEGRDTKIARRTCPPFLWRIVARKLDQLDSVTSALEMARPPGNRLEELRGDRKGEFSVRINDQYRLCFRCTGAGPEAVEIVDYH